MSPIPQIYTSVVLLLESERAIQIRKAVYKFYKHLKAIRSSRSSIRNRLCRNPFISRRALRSTPILESTLAVTIRPFQGIVLVTILFLKHISYNRIIFLHSFCFHMTNFYYCKQTHCYHRSQSSFSILLQTQSTLHILHLHYTWLNFLSCERFCFHTNENEPNF